MLYGLYRFAAGPVDYSELLPELQVAYLAFRDRRQVWRKSLLASLLTLIARLHRAHGYPLRRR